MEIFSDSLPALFGQGEDLEVPDVRSDILKNAKTAQVQASADLLENLRHMLNDPAFRDVVFLCKDGERVHALRLLLAGRSEVLKGMFMSGMVESNLSEIEMPETSSQVLLAVFEFLYTGTLDVHAPQSWRMACEVVIASRFFLLPNLETITRTFMHKRASYVVDNLPLAASMLTEAVEFKALCDEKDVNLGELVKILSSDWSDPFCAENLSEDAIHYLLANSKGLSFVNDGKLSFKEYLRFRQLIRWWVYQSSDVDWCPVQEQLVNFIAPGERRALSLCRHPDEGETVQNPFEDERFSNEWSAFKINEASSRNSTTRLLSNIELRCIHPNLLAKVVEPLKIVASEDILRAFRFHALRRPLIFNTLECDWEHGESHRTLEQGYVIHKATRNIGLAIMTAAMSISYVVYQWRFIVEEVPSEFCELGIIYDTRGMGAKWPSLESGKLSDVWQARVVDASTTRVRYNWSGNILGSFGWKEKATDATLCSFLCKGSIVAFNYNSYERTCSVTLNNKDIGILWKDLPMATYHPAVSLGQSSAGRVRVELVSGFNIL